MPPADHPSFEQFYTRCPDMACVIDDDGRFEHVNPAWEKALGHAPRELTGRALLDVVHPEDRPAAAGAVKALREGHGSPEVSIDLRGLAKDGAPRWLRWHAWAGEGDGRVYAMIRDISEERQLEGQLREEVEFNKTFMEASPTLIVCIGKDGKTLMLNDMMLTTLGYTREEVIGKDYMELFVPERDREILRQVFAKLAGLKGATLNENRVLAKDGREILVEWHGRPYHNPDGELEYIFGIGVEVGERRKMEEALLRSEKKLSLHIQQTPLGIIEWTPDFRFADWNPGAARIFGYTKEEVLGRKPVGVIISEEMAQELTRHWKGILSKEGGARLKAWNITKDGRAIVCEWYVTALFDGQGKVAGVMSIISDVTEQEALAEELRRRERAQAETIQRLSTPVIEVWKSILALPIIGELDDERAARMTEGLLRDITRTRAAFAIVDLTGMEGVDTANAGHLLKMVRAAELLGSRCLVSGISPAIAQTIIGLGLGLGGLSTFGTLRDALSFALDRTRAKA